MPVVFVVGAPRSGTTLVSQIFANSGAFGYVSNFVARFWEAPVLGARIEQALEMRETNAEYVSAYGVTNGLSGPHEFGYFWSRWFDFGETHHVCPSRLEGIDKEMLLRELGGLEGVFEKPLFFKSLTCGLQADFLTKLLPNAVWVICRRNPVYNMQSLLIAREEVFGSRAEWFSLRPKEHGSLVDLSPFEQVAAQVYYTLDNLKTETSNVNADRIVHVSYDDLCARPRDIAQQIATTLGQLGTSVEPDLENIPERFDSADVQRLNANDFRSLSLAARRYFPEIEIGA